MLTDDKVIKILVMADGVYKFFFTMILRRQFTLI